MLVLLCLVATMLFATSVWLDHQFRVPVRASQRPLGPMTPTFHDD